MTNLSVGWRAIAIYTLVSTACTLSWWRGVVPFLFLSSDSANIASFAAAWMDSGAFAADAVLGELDNYRFYATIHIPLLIGLSAIFGDLGTASISLLLPTMLLQAVGSHRLGLELTGGSLGGWLFGLTSFGMVPLTIDYYGTYPDVQPRFLFSAIVPFLLVGLIRRAERPRAWPALFAAHGLGMYVHPVSAPSVALASWLALAVRQRSRQGMLWLLAAGLAFLAVILPFALNYLSGHAYGESVNYDEIYANFPALFGWEFIDGWSYARTHFASWQAGLLLPLFGLAGAIAVWLLEPARRRYVTLLGCWTIGIVVASLGVTLAEQAITRALRILPPEIDTIRNLRYVVPILTYCGLWGAIATAQRVLSPPRAIVAASLVAIAWLVANKPGVIPVRATLACLAQGQLLCPPPAWLDRVAAYEWLKANVGRGVPVLPAVDRDLGIEVGSTIRYYARLPVVFSYKDGGTAFGYANHDKLGQWLRTAARLEADYRARDIAGLASLARENGASIVLLDFTLDAPPPEGWRVLYSRRNHTVLGRSAT